MLCSNSYILYSPGLSSHRTVTQCSNNGILYSPGLSSHRTVTQCSKSGILYSPGLSSHRTVTQCSKSGILYSPGLSSDRTVTQYNNNGMLYSPGLSSDRTIQLSLSPNRTAGGSLFVHRQFHCICYKLPFSQNNFNLDNPAHSEYCNQQCNKCNKLVRNTTFDETSPPSHRKFL